MDLPASAVRESITFKLSLSASQKGQRIGGKSNRYSAERQSPAELGKFEIRSTKFESMTQCSNNQ